MILNSSVTANLGKNEKKKLLGRVKASFYTFRSYTESDSSMKFLLFEPCSVPVSLSELTIVATNFAFNKLWITDGYTDLKLSRCGRLLSVVRRIICSRSSLLS